MVPLPGDLPGTGTGILPDAGGIVAGVDGSPSSHLALEWAADTAALSGLPLPVLFARPDAEGDTAGSATESPLNGPARSMVADIKERNPDLEVGWAGFPEPPVQFRRGRRRVRRVERVECRRSTGFPSHAPVGSPTIAFWAPLVLLAQEYPNTPVSFWEAEGRPGAVLVEQSRDSLLLAFGARGKGGFRGLVMGSVSQQLLAHAQCPVGVLHSTAAEAG